MLRQGLFAFIGYNGWGVDGVNEEVRKTLEKYGFQLEGSLARHEKLGIVREISDFIGIHERTELEEYVKSLLRNQCKVKRSR